MLACVVLASCGDDGDDDAAPEASPEAEATVTQDDDSGDTGTSAALVIDSDADETCDAQQAAEIDGTDLDVSLSGECGDVVISGGDHDVEIDSTVTVTVGGSDHDVDINSVSSLTVTGDDHDVEVNGSVERLTVEGSGHDIECDGSAAEIDDTSSDSDIEC